MKSITVIIGIFGSIFVLVSSCQHSNKFRSLATYDHKYSIQGTIVDVIEGDSFQGIMVIKGEKISEIYRDGDIIPASVPSPMIKNVVIYPGLVDVHNHLKYNFMSKWNPGKLYKNRYEWKKDKNYEKTIKKIYSKMYNSPIECVDVPEDQKISCLAEKKCELILYGEIKAILGGTTSLQGSLSFDSNNSDISFRGLSNFKRGQKSYRKEKELLACIEGLARNVEKENIIGPNKIRVTSYPIEDLIEDLIEGNVSKKIVNELKAKVTDTFFIHLAEGVDKLSYQEFETLKKIGLNYPGVVAIHGTALGNNEFKEMFKKGMGLAWSPSSNMNLYGKTTQIPLALKNRLIVGLGSDWTLSGTKNLLRELQYANRVNYEQFGGVISKSNLIRMATINGAKLLKLDGVIGSLEEGKYADLFIVKNKKRVDPIELIFQLKEEDLVAVVVGGRPVSGKIKTLKKFNIDDANLFKLEEKSCNNHYLVLRDQLIQKVFMMQDNLNKSFSKILENERVNTSLISLDPLCD